MIGSESWAFATGYELRRKMKLVILSCRSFSHSLGGEGRTSALWVYFDRMKVLRAIILPKGVKILLDQNCMLSSISFPIVTKFWLVSDALQVKSIPNSLKVVSNLRGIVGLNGVGSLFFPMFMHTVFFMFTSDTKKATVVALRANKLLFIACTHHNET